MKVMAIQRCPRCNSPKTGRIVAFEGNFRTEARMRAKAAKKGYMLHFVPPNEYSRYYYPNGLDSFCFECGYEFTGEDKVFDIKDKEEMEAYRYHKGIQNEIMYLSKKHGIFWRLKTRIKLMLKNSPKEIEDLDYTSVTTTDKNVIYKKG